MSILKNFKQDILKNLKIYGLYKENNKAISDLVLKKLDNLPLIYRGNNEIILNSLNKIKKDYSKYTTFINEYFISIKI